MTGDKDWSAMSEHLSGIHLLILSVHIHVNKGFHFILISQTSHLFKLICNHILAGGASRCLYIEPS